jgi:hypothetical protein
VNNDYDNDSKNWVLILNFNKLKVIKSFPYSYSHNYSYIYSHTFPHFMFEALLEFVQCREQYLDFEQLLY